MFRKLKENICIVMPMKTFHLHLVSDSTGGTLNSLVKACLAQFEGVKTEQHFHPLIRSAPQLQDMLAALQKNPGLVLYTLVDEALAAELEAQCKAMSLPCMSILHPVLGLMSGYFKEKTLGEAGLQYKLTAEYFARMDAMDYALHHDDGQQQDRNLHSADVILVGVSRTSKTPTCIYLAGRGVRAANIPFVPGIPPPELVMELEKPLFVGLTATPERLVEVRRNRLAHLGEYNETSYLDIAKVTDEVRDARRLCSKMGWPVIDVTRRSIEETAAEILTLLEHHRERMKDSA